MSHPTRRSLLAAVASAGLLGRGAVRAQAAAGFPTKPITLIVPFAPAGIADITARTVAQAMAQTLGQPVVIDNRPSAGSIVGSTAVAQAAPDGHTLLLVSNANAVSASLFKKLPFDIQKDFAPIGTLAFFDLAAFVDAGSRYKSVADVLAEGKARPGKLTIGTIAAGSTQHLSAELLKRRAGIDAVVVPYKGTPAVMTALRAGEIDVAFEIVAPMLAQISAKAVRALAVTSDVRHPALAGVPTMAEAGVANYNVASWNGLAAPKGTPAAVVDRLNRAIREALAAPTVVQRFAELGVRAQAGSPAQLSALLASEIPRWREVIVAAKIEPE
ncbi:MAG: tripartite tricarboxylate transporter substrate binding protein [Burkholderiaceae bacterium]